MKRAFLFTVILLLTGTFLFVGCAKEKKVTAKYKIGLVFDIGGRGDNSFNDSAYRGLKQVAETYKGTIQGDPDKVNFGSEVELKYLEPKSGGQDREQLLRALAEEGYSPIFAVGFLFTESVAKVAKDFPKTHFAIIDGWIPDLTDASNITCLAFAEHEGSFLVGAIAGLKNQKGKIGFIGGMDMPLIHKFQAGYIAGALYVNPALRNQKMVLAQYIGKEPSAFNDPKAGKDIASNFYKQGATIIYHAAGGSGDGLFQAAEENKKLAIGVDSDQGLIYASAKEEATKAKGKWILTSMLKRVDNSVFLTCKDSIDKGKVAGGYRSFGLKEDGVGYALNDFNKAELADVQAKVEEIKAKIIGGEIKVPDDDAKLAEYVKALK